MGAQVWFVRCENCKLARVAYSFDEAEDLVKIPCPACKSKCQEMIDNNSIEIG